MALHGRGDAVPITITDARVTSGLPPSYNIGDLTYSYTPATAPSQTISVGRRTEYTYGSTQANSGGGHSICDLSYFLQFGSGDPILSIVRESKYQNGGGGTTTTVNLNSNQMSGNNGVITTLIGTDLFIQSNAGTIGTVVALSVQDMSAITGITNFYAVKSDDPRAWIQSRGPIADRSFSPIVTPTTGQSLQIPDNCTTILYTPGGTLASLTLAMPINPKDGGDVYIYTTQTITTLTLTAAGKTLLGAPTTLGAGQSVRMKYYDSPQYWIRLGPVG